MVLLPFSDVPPAVCQDISPCYIKPLYIQIDISAVGINSDVQDKWQLWDLAAN